MTDSFRFGTLSFRVGGRATSAQAGSAAVSEASGARPTYDEAGCEGEGEEVPQRRVHGVPRKWVARAES